MKKTLKKLYRLAPFKKPLFTLLRVVYKPNENIYRHLHFQDIFEVPIDKDHKFKIHHYGFEIENSLFWAGIQDGWENISLRLWIELVKDSRVIFDIGANTGVYALAARSLNQEAKIYAFEPVKRVFEKLERNFRLNNFDIYCSDFAASNEDGIAVIYDTESEHTYSVTVNKNLQNPDVCVIPTEIKTIRLDTFIEQNELEKIDLIKLDVETFEGEVLEGMGKYLALFKPILLIEILNDEVGQKVENLIKGNGYLYFNIDDINQTIRQTDKLTKSDYFNYLLCDKATAGKLDLLKPANRII